MSAHSSGVLLFRFRNEILEVLLVHPGGPFWSRKEEISWSIPKGMIERDERPLDAAKREFSEETGFAVDGNFIDLGQSRQSNKKVVHIWALEGDLDPSRVSSNNFSVEWPKRSGIIREYPEIDRAGWFDIACAREKIQKGQAVFIDRLIEAINCRPEKECCQISGDPRESGFQRYPGLKGDHLTSGCQENLSDRNTQGKGWQMHKRSPSQLSLTKWSLD